MDFYKNQRRTLFIPTTQEELKSLNWIKLDIILISGDTYIDSPYSGVAIICKVLINEGYRVGIIAQPDINSETDIMRLGEPSLFWGVTSGSVDSMVSNYTATKKRRNQDDLTPGGINNKRPDRAVIAYTNLIRRYFKNTVPIVLGGIEASLRRIAHYDYWSNNIRRSILFDAKADILVYGMGESSIIQLADTLKSKNNYTDIRGLCYISKDARKGYIELPSFEDVENNKNAFIKMFDLFYQNNDSYSINGLYQQHNDRYLIHNPPSFPLSPEYLDKVYNLEYERDVHPYYKKDGEVRALDTIRFSIITHRGCFGECSFCAISMHQGRTITSRSEESVLKEAKEITKHPDFKGIINDLGGPTANMYQFLCLIKQDNIKCANLKCLYPECCPNLSINHDKQIKLLSKIRTMGGIKKVFVSSGIRYDLIFNDKENGEKYLSEIVKHHISGQMKVAPEHINKNILKLMRKPSADLLLKFKLLFDKLNTRLNKKQFLTYYFIAAHPGCTENEMKELSDFIKNKLKLKPEQVQVFTPTPSTYSTLMYYSPF